MEIKVLGTVSPFPYKNMNCPGFLISDGEYKVMLDCGTGSSRLLDYYKDLNKLAIFISHYHPDHYADILSLEYASYLGHKLGYLDQLVNVYLPETDKIEKTIHGVDKDGWGTSYKELADVMDYTFISDEARENYMEFKIYNQESKITHGSINLSFSINPHPINTYSARIENDDGVIVYSADTGFKSNSLTELANNADILICEATFLRGQEKKHDNHLFAYEAAKIARDANVKQLYLFHTYPLMDKKLYCDEAREIFENTNILNEGDVITLRKEK